MCGRKKSVTIDAAQTRRKRKRKECSMYRVEKEKEGASGGQEWGKEEKRESENKRNEAER